MITSALRIALGIFFVLAGANHFRQPGTYLLIMPAYLPAPRALVALSGALEIIGGLGALVPATRPAAGWLLILLLIGVFPANVYMATHGVQPAGWHVPPWGLWARLPFQLVLIGWVWWTCLR